MASPVSSTVHWAEALVDVEPGTGAHVIADTRRPQGAFLAEAPGEKLLRGLTQLEPGEKWLVIS